MKYHHYKLKIESFSNTKNAKKSNSNREYLIHLRTYKEYCIVCSKRSCRYNAYCGPSNRKYFRENRNWKYYRNTQYKE